MPMETGRNLEHTTERHQRGFKVPMEMGSEIRTNWIRLEQIRHVLYTSAHRGLQLLWYTLGSGYCIIWRTFNDEWRNETWCTRSASPGASSRYIIAHDGVAHALFMGKFPI